MKNDLITRYRNAAITHGEGTRSGDSVKTNRAYDELGVLLKKLQKRVMMMIFGFKYGRQPIH